MLLITIQGGWRWWDVGTSPVNIITEIDGARILCHEAHWSFVQVPQPIVGVLESGSTSPGNTRL